MDRRRFLQLFGGGVVASATMAEAGFLADFMAWLNRKPVWSIPSKPLVCTITQYYDFASFSDLVLETAIDPIVANTAKQLAYQYSFNVNRQTWNILNLAEID